MSESHEFKKYWRQRYSFDQTAEAILTGHDLDAYKARPPQLLRYMDQRLLCRQDQPDLVVLDYGCGMGRALHYLNQVHPTWQLVGFDNPVMVERIRRVWPDLPQPPLIHTKCKWTGWSSVASTIARCDLINAELVFQHMEPETLRERLPQLAALLRKSRYPLASLFLHTRRTLDDAKTPVLPIVEEFFKVIMYHDVVPDFVRQDGDSQDHFSLTLVPKESVSETEAGY